MKQLIRNLDGKLFTCGKIYWNIEEVKEKKKMLKEAGFSVRVIKLHEKGKIYFGIFIN
jgi:hypothetical protein